VRVRIPLRKPLLTCDFQLNLWICQDHKTPRGLNYDHSAFPMRSAASRTRRDVTCAYSLATVKVGVTVDPLDTADIDSLFQRQGRSRVTRVVQSYIPNPCGLIGPLPVGPVVTRFQRLAERIREAKVVILPPLRRRRHVAVAQGVRE
jgi:hypothetical protein